MLRKIRLTLAVLFFVAVTALFLDYTGTIHAWLGWTAKVQFLPALLAVNAGVVALLVLLTLLAGRVYCSVICPLGVMQDIMSWISGRCKKKKYRFSYSPEVKWLRYGVLGLFVIALIAGVGSFVALLAPYSSYGRIATNLFAPVYRWGNNLLAYFAERADSYAGNLFEVNGILYMAKRDVAEGAGTLSVDGSVEGETQVTGSLVHVASGAKFAMTTGITLTNNTTTARGAAIFNEGGTVQITGGQISNNHSDGGAVYSTGMILVKKGDGAADTEPTITGNTKTDGQTAANVVLAGTDGKIVVNGEITSPQIGFSVENAAENYVAIAKSEDVTDEAFKAALGVLAPHYEGDKNFKVDTTTGALISNRPTVKITGSTWENGSTTATATITSDKAGTYYYKWVAKGAAAPSIDDATEGVAIAAGETASVSLKNLTGSVVDLYVWVKANDGSVNAEPAKKTIKQTAATVTKPVIKAVGSKWSGRTKVSVTLNTTKAGTCYYKWVVRGKTAKNDKKNKVDVSKAGNFSIPLDKLDSKNKIDLLVWFEDKDKQEVSKRIKLLESKRPKETTTTKASLRWTGLSWRDHSSATVTCIIGADGVCNYTWKVKGSDKDGGS